ncbi:MAG: hypothetical protein A2X94_07270 [Bdellovibrionales bacterium GWB1_55_8]|nr:MAG: hypothetical protein A2X94_07270 [Bdellovibrionales bacterium GWB1_55_8]
MNIRLDPGSMRFRLSEEELSLLLRSGQVRSQTPLPNGDFVSYEVRVNPESSASSLSLSSHPGLFLLSVTKVALEELRLSEASEIAVDLPIERGHLSVILDVDLFSRKRSR